MGVIAKPFGWVLYQLYLLIGSYGVSLIIFTIISKLVLLPFQIKSKKSTIAMQRIQPRLKELEKKYKNNKEAYAVAVQKLYKDENVSMTGGCLPLLITIPIMLGLYAVVRQPLTYMFGVTADQLSQLAELVGLTVEGNIAYSEIQIASLLGNFQEGAQAIVPGLPMVDFNFLGMNLAAIPSWSKVDMLWIIPLLSGGTSFIHSWMLKKKQPQTNNEQAAGMTGMMTWLMPIMSAYIAFVVPAGLGFYWIISNILMIAQEPLMDWYLEKKEGAK
ncbi:MAG: YidC/Oxa1 family membrane protein insertase [Oscillospiraceae bacterium]|nr:YidC/Oxa1 family membrane protein insertase [Oscillospiraceae bacterium]